MLHVVSLVVLLLSFASALEDFSETYNGYEYVYHNAQKLLLTIHDNSCYFALVDDGTPEQVQLEEHRQDLLNYVQHYIETNGDGQLKPTTLEAARNQFHDILANYRCSDKDIYIYQLELRVEKGENGDWMLYMGAAMFGAPTLATAAWVTLTASAAQKMFEMFMNPFSWILG